MLFSASNQTIQYQIQHMLSDLTKAGVEQQRLIGIQILRAVAALFVAFAHNHDILLTHGIEVYDGWVGGIGVDIFFIISGYIMFHISSTTAGGGRASAEFLAKRIVRVAPIYWLTLIAILVAWLLSGSDMYSRLHQDSSLVRILSNILFVDRFPIVTVGWTLCFEMMFYAFAATAIFLFSKQSSRLIAVTLFVLATLFFRYVAKYPIFFSGQIMSINFLIGGYIWWIIDAVGIAGSPKIGILFLCLAVLATALLYGRHQYNHASIPWVFTATLWVVGAILADGFFFGPMATAFAALGNASYSLYLTHLYVILFSVYLLNLTDHLPVGHGQAIAVCCLNLLIACAVSIVVYRGLELKLTRSLTSKLLRYFK